MPYAIDVLNDYSIDRVRGENEYIDVTQDFGGEMTNHVINNEQMDAATVEQYEKQRSFVEEMK